MTPTLLLSGIALFQLKHLVADFLLQTKYVVTNKGRYGHPGGLIHTGIHMLGSIPVLMFLGVGTGAIAAIVIAEGLVHYHLDVGKDKIGAMLNVKITEWRYWALFGIDQFFHQVTYVVIVWFVGR